MQQLAEVAGASVKAGAPPAMEALLACVKNIRQVALLLQQPGRRFKGPTGLQAAAVCIQAHWRCALLCAVIPADDLWLTAAGIVSDQLMRIRDTLLGSCCLY